MSNFIVAPAAAWLVAHVIKLAISAYRSELDWRQLYASGGFPSGHTSLVTGLAATSVLELGLSDPLTGVCLVLMGIVIYDAQGVRRAAEVLASQVSQLSRDTNIQLELPVSTARGHTVLEIAGGAINGAVVAWIVHQLWL